jgi:hypothetical protein
MLHYLTQGRLMSSQQPEQIHSEERMDLCCALSLGCKVHDETPTGSGNVDGPMELMTRGAQLCSMQRHLLPASMYSIKAGADVNIRIPMEMTHCTLLFLLVSQLEKVRISQLLVDGADIFMLNKR